MEKQYPNVGIYEHYKSTPEDRRLYQLLSMARHTETGEALAIYFPLYTVAEHTGLQLQARPLDMFMQDVEYEGKRVPRFRYIGPEL